MTQGLIFDKKRRENSQSPEIIGTEQVSELENGVCVVHSVNFYSDFGMIVRPFKKSTHTTVNIQSHGTV